MSKKIEKEEKLKDVQKKSDYKDSVVNEDSKENNKDEAQKW